MIVKKTHNLEWTGTSIFNCLGTFISRFTSRKLEEAKPRDRKLYQLHCTALKSVLKQRAWSD